MREEIMIKIKKLKFNPCLLSSLGLFKSIGSLNLFGADIVRCLQTLC